MKTNNLTNLYEHIYKASDNIKGETIEYNRGFQDAVYMLKLALDNFEQINLHIENRKLKRKLLITDLNFDDACFKIANLEKEIKRLKKYEPSKALLTVDNSDYKKCEIEIDGFMCEFWANANQEQIDLHLPEVGLYIAERLSKRRRKHGPKHKQDYAVWCMEVLRKNGIECNGK